MAKKKMIEENNLEGVVEPLRVRIDKWLWAARFYKTRALAIQAVEQGKVLINAERVRPARAGWDAWGNVPIHAPARGATTFAELH